MKRFVRSQFFLQRRLRNTLRHFSSLSTLAVFILVQPCVRAQMTGGIVDTGRTQASSIFPELPITVAGVERDASAGAAVGRYESSLTAPSASVARPGAVRSDAGRAVSESWSQAKAASEHTATEATEPAITPQSRDHDALTWHGITLYGAYDVGVGWVSHGLPENGYNYEGESLVNRNGYQHRFLIAPNNLQQTGFGVRGKIGFGPGWFAVFNGSTGINPQSGLLANASKTDIINNGLPRSSYSEAIDGARAGQPLNDEYYGGVSSERFGILTFGRQRSLGTDVMLLYDPAGGSYAFSYIGYNGTLAGGGNTEDSRWDDAVKYRVNLGRAHLAAMYKFADGNGGCFSASASWTAATCTPETAHNNAYGSDLGGDFHKLSGELVYQHYNQAISVVNPLLGPQSLTAGYQSTTDSVNKHPINGANLIATTDTVYGIVTDNNAFLTSAKYTGERFRIFGGFEYIWQNNPHNPLGVGASDQGGYLLSGVENSNLDTEKITRIWWTGVKYAYDKKTDITIAWYGQLQNDFRSPQACSIAAGIRPACAGGLDEGSLYADHRFSRHFDGFAGLAYSFVYGGLAIAIPNSGVAFLHNSNFAPTLGGRFSF